jgi:hypothetical protein
MKMPSTKGIITIDGDYQKSVACATASSRLAESLVIVAEKRLVDRVVAMAGKQLEMSSQPKESEAEGSFKPAKETKKIPLDPEPRRGTLSLVQTWTANRKASSSISSMRIGTSLHGLLKTCRVFRRISPSTSYMSDLMPSRSGSPCAACQKRREESLEKK